MCWLWDVREGRQERRRGGLSHCCHPLLVPQGNATPPYARPVAPLPPPHTHACVQVFNEQVPRHELGEGNAGLVVIRNGTVRVHWLRGKDNHWRFACIKSAVESARSLNFPDTAFIVNIDDFPICKAGRCPLPVFTNYKKWRGGKNLETNEVLFPVSAVGLICCCLLKVIFQAGKV